MKIYYLKKSETLKKIYIDELKLYDDGRKYNSEEKYIEHLLGLYLVKNVLKKYYKLDDPQIEVVNKKPELKNSNLHFSLSHSNDIVMVGISEKNIGLDIEFMQEKDYEKILKRINRLLVNPTKLDFYEIWTQYEAEIKLSQIPKSFKTMLLEDNYMLSVVSACDIVDVELIELFV